MKRCGLCGNRIWWRARYTMGAWYHRGCYKIKTQFLDKIWEAMSYLDDKIKNLKRRATE